MESSSQAGRHRKWDTVAATWGVPRPEMSRSSCEQRLHGSSLQEGSFLVDLDVGECGEVQKLGTYIFFEKAMGQREDSRNLNPTGRKCDSSILLPRYKCRV